MFRVKHIIIVLKSCTNMIKYWKLLPSCNSHYNIHALIRLKAPSQCQYYETSFFWLFKLQLLEQHMPALQQQTLSPYGKVFLKFLSLKTHAVLNPLVKAPVTPQTSGTEQLVHHETQRHCWCFHHPWISPQVITALCVPDRLVRGLSLWVTKKWLQYQYSRTVYVKLSFCSITWCITSSRPFM